MPGYSEQMYQDAVRRGTQQQRRAVTGNGTGTSALANTPGNQRLQDAYQHRDPASYLPPQIPGLDVVGRLNGPTDVLSPADLQRLRAQGINTANARARQTIGNLGTAMGRTGGAAFRNLATRAATGANAGAAAANSDVALQASKLNSDSRNARLDQIMRYVMGEQGLGQGQQRIDLEGTLGFMGSNQNQQRINQSGENDAFQQWLQRQQYLDALMRQQSGGQAAGAI